MILYKTKKSEIVRVDGSSDKQSLKKYSTTIIGDGIKTVFTIQHNLDTENIIFEMNDGTEPTLIDYVVIDKDNINITFAVAPTSSEKYNIKIYGTSKSDNNNNGSNNNENNSDDNNTIDPSKIGTIHDDWDYTIDDTNNIITLNYYTGSAEDVTVYGNYTVDGSKTYKTKLKSKNGNMSKYMFAGNRNVKNIIFNDDLDTSSCTNMFCMFYFCKSLTSLVIDNFNTSNVTNMSYMFAFCESLTNLNVSNFDTSNVIDMVDMFKSCKSLVSLDVINFDTSNVADMEGIFSTCESVTTIDLSNFDTSNVINMRGMFYGSKSITSLDLSSFDTGNVINMSTMFYECSSLASILVANGKWVTSQANISNMFDLCGVSDVIYV